MTGAFPVQERVGSDTQAQTRTLQGLDCAVAIKDEDVPAVQCLQELPQVVLVDDQLAMIVPGL